MAQRFPEEMEIRGFPTKRIVIDGTEYMEATFDNRTWYLDYADRDADEQEQMLFRPDTSGLFHPVTP